MMFMATASTVTIEQFMGASLSSHQSWFTVRTALRNLICGGQSFFNRCEGADDDKDFFLMSNASRNDQGLSNRFVVSCNQSWMLYQAISLPITALETQDTTLVSITAVEHLPDLADRGPNQVLLTTKHPNNWLPFVKIRNDVVDFLYGHDTRSEMQLINGSCNTVATSHTFYNNCNWIVSMLKLSQQVEISSIAWKGFTADHVHYCPSTVSPGCKPR